MNRNLIGLLFLMSFAFYGVDTKAQKIDSSFVNVELLERMFDAVNSLDYAEFEMFSKERIDGELEFAHAKGVLQFTPRKVFIRGFNEEGELLNEVLYLEGENNNNALISPNGFPYINLSLDPKGAVMRRNRHFTILEAGGRYLVEMLAMGLAKYKAMGSFEERFHFMGETESTIAVAIVNNDYDFTSYTVLANENCSDVALKLGIPDYKIIEINDEVDGFEDLEKGQIIKVPTLYANRVELILRKHDLIPIEVRIFDENGLYSEYVYTHFNTNPVITAETFKSDNPAYTF